MSQSQCNFGIQNCYSNKENESCEFCSWKNTLFYKSCYHISISSWSFEFSNLQDLKEVEIQFSRNNFILCKFFLSKSLIRRPKAHTDNWFIDLNLKSKQWSHHLKNVKKIWTWILQSQSCIPEKSGKFKITKIKTVYILT